MLPIEVECPDCHGRGRTYTYPDGRVFGGEKEYFKANKIKKADSYGHYHKMQEWKKKQGIDYRRCPTCPQKRSRSFGLLEYGTGIVVEFKLVDVTVGYPIFAKGAKFDSRFHNAIYSRSTETDSGNVVHSVCELCSKSIHGRYSHLVPVQAKGVDGKLHAMWVGPDCALKILGVEIVLTEDQKEEMKKSLYKGRFIISQEVK